MKISLLAATSLTDLSENTLRRRIADGVMTRVIEEGPNGRSMISFESIRHECCVPIEVEDLALISEADRGKADAQNDLALLFFTHKKAKNALFWLELAVKQKHTDAMHWLGRCHIEGNGVAQNENLGFMWLAKAASQGHVVSQEMMQSIRRKVLCPEPLRD